MVINISEGVCPTLLPKAAKIGRGTDQRREGRGSLTGTEKDLNGNTQTETETKEISGI